MKLFKSLKAALAAKDEVTHLKLTLSGIFPGEVLELKELREIYLDGECSAIPSLRPLTDLQLISLTLPTIKTGLHEILMLPRLKNLKIIGAIIDEFTVPQITELAPLQSLTIKDCELKTLPGGISRLGLLSEINLDSNSLSDLPQEFKNLHHLKRLNLDRNAFQIFPSVLTQMNSLKHLSMDGNPFSEDEKARIQRHHHLTIH